MARLCTEEDGVFHTSSGLTFSFKAGEAREIPDQFKEELEAFGCKTSENNLDEVLLLIMENGNPDDFKVDNTPKINVVNSLLDTKLSAREITSRFRELINEHSGFN